MMAVISLWIGLRPLIQAKMNALAFTEPNAVTLTIFFGTLFFGLFALMGAGFLYARWNELRSRWMKITMAFSVTGIFIVGFVFQFGRASCRERVCQCVDLGGSRIIKKKKNNIYKGEEAQ